MTSPFPSRTIWRRRVDPDGTRWAVARGHADIPFVPIIEPPPGQVTARTTRLRVRSFGPPITPTGNDRDLINYLTMNPGLIPGNPTSYVGTLPGSTLTRYPAVSGDGNFTATAAHANSTPANYQGVATGSTGTGTIIENLDIHGVINIGTLQNVYIRNCRIRGTAAIGSGVGCVNGSGDNARGVIIEDCLLENQYANGWQTGIRGSNFTVARCEVTGQADGIGFTSQLGGRRVYGSWLHNGAFGEWGLSGTQDPNYPPQGSNYLHCDGIQFHTGTGGTARDIVRGNYIGGARNGVYLPNQSPSLTTQIRAGDDFYTSSLMIVHAGTNNGTINALIENNWLEGGFATININYNDNDFLAGVTIQNNTFPRQTMPTTGANSGVQKYILRATGFQGVLSNNRHPDGALVVISQG